MSTRRQNMA
uniref:Uncharacterized protein n=1 Tax=Arundo donax TaxID=35708 RepID=A0A0A8XSH4_ARUDO